MSEANAVARRWGAAFTGLLSITLALVLIAPSPLQPGLACDAVTGAVLSTAGDSAVPLKVLEDARILSESFYAGDNAKRTDMTNQLVGTYLAAQDKDFIVIFNPGGWGWDPLTDIPGWESIVKGIESTLGGLGYSSMGIDYKRTRHGFNGVVDELEVLTGIQPEKAHELAGRIDFLTQHLPKLHVILTGESNGAAVADDVMRLLQDNPRVYTILTGPSVWHPCLEFERSLVIKNNGEQMDAFTIGDLILIMRSNAESAFGIYQGARGDILLYIGAPGHFYSWDYSGVRTQVNDFLTSKFPLASQSIHV